MSNAARLVAAGIIEWNGHYLISQRRPDEPLPNLWQFPITRTQIPSSSINSRCLTMCPHDGDIVVPLLRQQCGTND